MNADTAAYRQVRIEGTFPKERLAVALMFFGNGLYTGAWSPKVPSMSAELGLSPQWVGYLLLAFGLGSITIMPIAGSRISRFGSTKVALAFSLLFLPMMLIITLAPNFWLAACAVFFFGGFTGAMDVAMNANAVEVEKGMGRAIMSSCHAYWSFGALAGSATGGYMIEYFGPFAHAAIITVVDAVILSIAFSIALKDGPHQEEPGSTGERKSIFSSLLPWLIGIMALFSMIQEGIVIDWSALYLKSDLAAPLAIASLAAGAFHGTMMIMRFLGDGVRDRLGAVRTMRISGIIALGGILAGGLATNAYMAIAGFAIAGLGVSNLVPIAFSAAGNLPGMAKGVGLSVVTVMGYSGTLFAPTLFGFVVEHTGYKAVYLGAPMLLLVVLGLSSLGRFADNAKAGR